MNNELIYYRILDAYGIGKMQLFILEYIAVYDLRFYITEIIIIYHLEIFLKPKDPVDEIDALDCNL